MHHSSSFRKRLSRKRTFSPIWCSFCLILLPVDVLPLLSLFDACSSHAFVASSASLSLVNAMAFEFVGACSIQLTRRGCWKDKGSGKVLSRKRRDYFPILIWSLKCVEGHVNDFHRAFALVKWSIYTGYVSFSSDKQLPSKNARRGLPSAAVIRATSQIVQCKLKKKIRHIIAAIHNGATPTRVV